MYTFVLIECQWSAYKGNMHLDVKRLDREDNKIEFQPRVDGVCSYKVKYRKKMRILIFSYLFDLALRIT